MPAGLLASNMGAEAWLPTPTAKKDLGDGNSELTLKALQPLKLVSHGIADGMKHSDETTFMVRAEAAGKSDPSGCRRIATGGETQRGLRPCGSIWAAAWVWWPARCANNSISRTSRRRTSPHSRRLSPNRPPAHHPPARPSGRSRRFGRARMLRT
jgi:hypothetical protein